MAFGSDRSANFVIAAKDAATGPIGNIGKAMGRLKSSAGAAFKAIAAGAVAAAAAVAGFVAASIKGAIEDERSTVLTNAALKARGFELDKLGPKIAEQITALQKFGKSDDDVRAGLEVGSRYIKNQTKLLQANAAAAAISSVTGKDMATVMGLIGKAANGSTRGLAALIGPIEKGATLTDILTQANEKFLPVAEELANTVGGKMATAQLVFNEQMDALGARFLPAVSAGMDFLAKNVLPITDELMTALGDTMMNFGTKLTEKGGVVDSVLAVVGPIGEDLGVALGDTGTKLGTMVGKIGELVTALWGDGKGPLAIAIAGIGGVFEVFLATLNLVLDVINFIIDAAVKAMKLLEQLGRSQARMDAGAAAAAGSTVFGSGTGVGGGTPGGGTSGYGGFSGQAVVTFGRDATSSFDAYLGGQSSTTGATRTDGRP